MEMPLDLVAAVRCLPRFCASSNELQHALGADACENAFLDDHFAVGSLEQPAAAVGILAFGVLAHDEEIDLARLAAGQRRRHARHEPHGAQIDVLIEFAAEFEQRAPQRLVVRDCRGPADRAEENRFMLADLCFPVVRHHLAVLGVVVAAPVEMVPLEFDAKACRHRIQHLQAFRYDLFADAVSRKHCNLVFLSHRFSFSSWVYRPES
jgi:hypothetical protein